MGNRNSGPKPLPTALKVLRGNPGRRDLNALEPTPPAGPVDKPPGISGGAGVIWDELAPICLAMGTLTVADRHTFWQLCELQAMLHRASPLKDAGDWDEAMRIEKIYAPMIRSYYEFFGLTPSSRSRIAVPKPKELPDKKWAGQLK
jgi:hypothetical protein